MKPCPICNGNGHLGKCRVICSVCGGDGEVPELMERLKWLPEVTKTISGELKRYDYATHFWVKVQP